ncbi:hypothetical protein GCM10023185_01480 [Hymenobacter saemangeumensis]|uniref:Uncharacterized protein n=1 Tax=Hymenobacter saemangeumensis TaxID=1084522 RepID=A0ABP8HXP4_9BACT
MTHKSKWLLFAPAGLVLVGAGASMLPWAGGLKEKGRPAPEWVAAGTLALAVFNAGLSIFGRGVVEKVLHELREKPQPATMPTQLDRLRLPA